PQRCRSPSRVRRVREWFPRWGARRPNAAVCGGRRDSADRSSLASTLESFVASPCPGVGGFLNLHRNGRGFRRVDAVGRLRHDTFEVLLADQREERDASPAYMAK